MFRHIDMKMKASNDISNNNSNNNDNDDDDDNLIYINK